MTGTQSPVNRRLVGYVCLLVALLAAGALAAKAEDVSPPVGADWCRGGEWVYWGAADAQGRCDVHRRDKDGDTPLAWAVRRSEPEVVRVLIRDGADVNARILGGPTVLAFAAGGAPSIARMLIEAGADVSLVDSNKATPLHNAGDAGTARLLVAAGANVEARDWAGETPLFGAVRAGNEDVVAYLLVAGANVNARDRDGASVLHSAAMSGNAAVTELVRRHGGVDKKSFADDGDDHPVMSLIDAANGCNRRQMAMILDACRKAGNCAVNTADPNGLTALVWASVKCDAGLVQLLVDAGADASTVGANSPLMAAASAGHAEVVATLLRAKADPNQRDSSGQTPLVAAAAWEDVALAKALLDAHADVNATDREGLGPLFMAVLASNTPVAQLLLEAGANPNSALQDGTTPLKQAQNRRNVEMESLLRHHGAR